MAADASTQPTKYEPTVHRAHGTFARILAQQQRDVAELVHSRTYRQRLLSRIMTVVPGDSGADGHRDSLYYRDVEGRESIRVVTYPGRRPLERGLITSYGSYLYYCDGWDWFALNVFGEGF